MTFFSYCMSIGILLLALGYNSGCSGEGDDDTNCGMTDNCPSLDAGPTDVEPTTPDAGTTPDPCVSYTSMMGTNWVCVLNGVNYSFQCTITLYRTGDNPPKCEFDCGHDGISCPASPIDSTGGFQCGDSYYCTQ